MTSGDAKRAEMGNWIIFFMNQLLGTQGFQKVDARNKNRSNFVKMRRIQW
jgi:hypothetical protein